MFVGRSALVSSSFGVRTILQDEKQQCLDASLSQWTKEHIADRFKQDMTIGSKGLR